MRPQTTQVKVKQPTTNETMTMFVTVTTVAQSDQQVCPAVQQVMDQSTGIDKVFYVRKLGDNSFEFTSKQTGAICVVRDTLLVGCQSLSGKTKILVCANLSSPLTSSMETISSIEGLPISAVTLFLPVTHWALWQIQNHENALNQFVPVASPHSKSGQSIAVDNWIFVSNAPCRVNMRGSLPERPLATLVPRKEPVENHTVTKQHLLAAPVASSPKVVASAAAPVQGSSSVAKSEEQQYATRLAQFLTDIVADLCCDNDKKTARKLFYRSDDETALHTETILQWVDAFTHISYSPHCYESLEYFGDRVLKTAFAYYMFQRFPDVRESEISTAERLYVSKVTQAKLCKKLGFAEWIRRRNVPLTVGMTEDVFESFFGALARTAEMTIRPEIGGSGEVFARRALSTLFNRHLSIDLVDVKDSQNLVKEAYEAYRVEHPVHSCTPVVKQRNAVTWSCKLYEVDTVQTGRRTQLLSAKAAVYPRQTFVKDERTLSGFCISSSEGPSIESAVKRAYSNAVQILEAQGFSQREIRLRRMKNRLDPLGELGEKALRFAQEMNFEAMKFQEVKSVSGSVDTDCASSEWNLNDSQSDTSEKSASGGGGGGGGGVSVMRMMMIVWGFRSIADDQRQVPIFLARGVVVHTGHTDRQHLSELANRLAIENLVAEFENPIAAIAQACSWLKVQFPSIRVQPLLLASSSSSSSTTYPPTASRYQDYGKAVALVLETCLTQDRKTDIMVDVLSSVIPHVSAQTQAFRIEIVDETNPSFFSVEVWGAAKVRVENLVRGIRTAALRAMEHLRSEAGLDYGSRTVFETGSTSSSTCH